MPPVTPNLPGSLPPLLQRGYRPPPDPADCPEWPPLPSWPPAAIWPPRPSQTLAPWSLHRLCSCLPSSPLRPALPADRLCLSLPHTALPPSSLAPPWHDSPTLPSSSSLNLSRLPPPGTHSGHHSCHHALSRGLWLSVRLVLSQAPTGLTWCLTHRPDWAPVAWPPLSRRTLSRFPGDAALALERPPLWWPLTCSPEDFPGPAAAALATLRVGRLLAKALLSAGSRGGRPGGGGGGRPGSGVTGTKAPPRCDPQARAHFPLVLWPR